MWSQCVWSRNLLRGAGYEVVMLGPDVPAGMLGDAQNASAQTSSA
jgi:hypothetical protein